jgi:hydroxyacid-oxoacid transhydrogenase
VSDKETIFTWQAPPFKFGPGAIDEIGHDLAQFGVDRVLLVTDRNLSGTGVPQRIADGIRATGRTVAVYDETHVEPTDVSFAHAVEFASRESWDGFVAVGGGSVIDTAKAINLFTSHPGDILDYVNAPIGRGRAPGGPLKPLVAVPTTAGTGAESTAVCVLDLLDLKVKSGISHPRLRPSLAVIDPTVTLTLPPEVTAAAGMDILGHAIESYTAKPYAAFDRRTADQRVAYCGSNPVSDAWCQQAIQLVGRAFRTAVRHGDDLSARTDMMLAATFAGMGFGNAGVHIPHACAYPIAGNVKEYRPAGYRSEEPMVPHGQAVAVTTPAAFRTTFETSPDRHARAAGWLDPTVADSVGDPALKLPTVLANLMSDIGIPSGLSELGYRESDIDVLVDGALKQHRLLSIAPLEVTAQLLEQVFRDSLHNW